MPEVSKKTVPASKPNTEVAFLDELDSLFVEYVEKLQDYVRNATEEERLMKDGYINIAHARMCMRPYQLTADGYTGCLDEIKASTTTSVSPADSGEANRRTVCHDKSEDGKTRSRFGKMLPSSLKTAQSSFLRVIERQIERSNIVTRLEEIQSRISVLRRQVNDLRSKDSDVENVLEQLSLS